MGTPSILTDASGKLLLPPIQDRRYHWLRTLNVIFHVTQRTQHVKTYHCYDTVERVDIL